MTARGRTGGSPAGWAGVLEIQRAALVPLLEKPTVEEAAPQLIAAICTMLDCSVGALWLVDQDVDALRCAGTWARDPGAVAAFLDDTRGRRFARGEGLPGRVWDRAAPLTLADVTIAGNFPRRAAAEACNLRGAFAFPIPGRDRVLGVLEGFNERVGNPGPTIRQAVESVGGQIGLALERQQTEREQSRISARLGTLIQSLQAAILVEDEHRRIAVVNQAFCDVFGIPAAPEALVGTDCSRAADQAKALFREPGAFVVRTEAALAKGQSVIAEEFEFVDGRIFERDYVPVLVEGVLAGHLWAYRDVTAQRRAELENSRLRGFYEEVLEAIPAQVAVFDLDCRFLYANSASIADREIRRWVIGKTNEEYCRYRGIPVEVGRERTRVIRGVIRDRKLCYFEETFERHGQVRTFGRFIGPVVDAGGNVVQVVGFGHDLTEMKRAESALAASEARLRAILESALDCVITIDADGRVLDFSPAAESTFGHARADVLGREMAGVLVPDRLREAHRRGLQHYLATGEGPVLRRRVEVPALRADGSEFPVELAITPVGLADGQQIFTAFVRDITERKRAESALQEARIAAERSAAAREQFLATISHELRTPLNAIVGLTHLLEGSALDAEQARSVNGIRFSADSLLGVISDILDFSRARSGRIYFESIPFGLRSLLDGLLNTLRVSAGARGLSLELEVDREVPEHVRGDPMRLNQVLLNLVGNAIKFTERGGVSLRVERASYPGSALALCFCVSDTGIGIAPEERDRIFEAFQQASPETSRRFGGSGLGLAIVDELVRQQGGSIAVESEMGVGSVFQVTLPFGEVTGEPAAAPAAEAASLTGRRLLLVEDNELNRLVATRILEQAGAEVVTACNGREALNEVERQAFDLVLMDIQMPEMDGYEATWRIRHELGISEKQMPIIALTATALTDEQRRAQASGMTDYILKPFRPDLLSRRLAGLLAVNTMPAAHVDRRLLEANTLGQTDFARDVLAVFLRVVPGKLDQLDAAAGAGDGATIGAVAHMLKSQAGTIGASGLQRALEELESEARSAAAHRIPGLQVRARAATALGRAVVEEVARLMDETAGTQT